MMFVFNPVAQYSTTNFSPSCTATTASRSSWAYLRPVDRRLRSLARRISSKAGRRVAQQVGYGGNVQQKRRAASGYPVRQLRLMRIPCASLNQWNALPATLILRCMHVAMFMSNAFISPLPPRIQSILVLRIRNGRGPPLSEMTSHSPTSTALQPYSPPDPLSDANRSLPRRRIISSYQPTNSAPSPCYLSETLSSSLSCPIDKLSSFLVLIFHLLLLLGLTRPIRHNNVAISLYSKTNLSHDGTACDGTQRRWCFSTHQP